jgi:AmmeMemoRadiSam system protein B
LDHQVINELRSNSEAAFKSIRMHEDEEEHSIEMQIPFLRHIFGSRQDVTLIPIYVGALLQNEERLYGRALSRYFDDPACLFVVSTDFCHFGHRFRFTPREFPIVRSEVYSQESINGNIESLDRQAMQFISNGDCEGFFKYLQSTGNTICGKNPILIFLQILRHAQTKVQVDFINYSQSNDLPATPSREDSCVSYAAGIAFS